MATTISVVENHGQQYIQLRTDVTVTYAATYQMKYTIQDGSGDTLYSDPFTLAANGSTRTSTVMFYSPEHNIKPGTSYTFRCVLCNANDSSNVTETSVYQYITVTTNAIVTITYRDGSSSSTSSGASLTVLSSGLTSPSGWTFRGWATSTGTNAVAYSGGETITAGSSNQNITLYAVYRQYVAIYFVYGLDYAAHYTRYRYQWRYNTSATSYTTSYYTLSDTTLPTVTESVTTTTPGRSWTPLGWRTDTTAGAAAYSFGASVTTSSAIGALPTTLYAVYSNTVTITYNSNGGSGSMSSSSATAYYNTSGNYTKPTITLRTNTFTAPTGKEWKAWCPYADGSGTLYYTSITTSYHATMYAIWKAKRPDDWAWTSTVTQKTAVTTSQGDNKFYAYFLTASEWLDFVERIQEFAEYLGVTLTSSYITQATSGVSSGSAMMAAQANGARLLINQLNPPTAAPAAVMAGSSGITAAFINGLKNSLNSIE